jgi:hypothetical protein
MHPAEVTMKNLTVSLFLIAITIHLSAAQNKSKLWPEWSRKEAERVLNDSPWGQTQVETDLSEMFFRPQADPNIRPGAADPNRDKNGSTNQATNVKYRIRFLSAKPIRQALARLITMEQTTENKTIDAYLLDFVERNFDEWIAITVSFEANDGRLSGEALQSFSSATSASLKNQTYLERKDGKRLFLETYYAPSADGLGAKFIFPRIVDKRPFLNRESGEVRFVSEVSDKLKLNMRFKVKDMMYDGTLEY